MHVGRASAGALLIGVVAIACGGSWPPVVSTASDVSKVPAGQREIRCVACDDATLQAVGARLHSLDFLFLNGQSRITDRGVQALRSLAALRQLHIGNGTRLTDASLDTLAALPALRELSIDYARGISDEALMAFAAGSRLERFFMLDAANLRPDTVERIRERMPAADIQITLAGQGAE